MIYIAPSCTEHRSQHQSFGKKKKKTEYKYNTRALKSPSISSLNRRGHTPSKDSKALKKYLSL